MGLLPIMGCVQQERGKEMPPVSVVGAGGTIYIEVAETLAGASGFVNLLHGFLGYTSGSLGKIFTLGGVKDGAA